MRKYELLELRAVDFYRTSYGMCKACAISKGIKRQFGIPIALEAISYVYVGVDVADVIMNHRLYLYKMFEKDKSLAASHNYDK